jgi:hypothetical protein
MSRTRSIPYWTTSVFYCDWLGSDLWVSHFFNFRCPLVNTPQLNTQISYEWILVVLASGDSEDDCGEADGM